MRPVQLLARAAVVAGLVSTTSCDNAGSALGLTVPGTGALTALVYLDRDGSFSRTQADTVFQGAKVSVTSVGGGLLLRSATSNQSGEALVSDVAYGDYSVIVDPASIGDSLIIGGLSHPRVQIRSEASLPAVTIRLEYPEVSIKNARLLPLGKRVMVRGLVLSGVQSFRDTTSHVRDTTVAIRLTRATVRGDFGGNNPGDSVTVLGTVSTRAGQPTLDRAMLSVFGQRPGPTPLQLASAVAATAQAGVLDAGLVLVSNVVISESGAQAPDYRVVASDGSGPITIIFDGNIPLNPADLPVGRTISVRGVLVPDGAGKWQLKPRNGGDVTLF